MQGLTLPAQPTKKPRLLSFVVSSGNERCGADHYGMLNVNMGKRFYVTTLSAYLCFCLSAFVFYRRSLVLLLLPLVSFAKVIDLTTGLSARDYQHYHGTATTLTNNGVASRIYFVLTQVARTTKLVLSNHYLLPKPTLFIETDQAHCTSVIKRHFKEKICCILSLPLNRNNGC
jgi:hypothetical protein